MSTTRWQAAYAWVFRRLVGAIRRLRPHHWPVVGRAVGVLAEAIMSRTHPPLISIDGHRFHLDPRDDLGLARGRPYEPLLREAMVKHIPSGGTVVDGGAHIGYHTLLAAQLVGPGGKVVSFEPAPATYALLEENVELNGYKNITTVRGALADHRGQATLHLSSDTTGDNRINMNEGRNTVPVEVYSLDAFFEGERVDFIKLDVQGAEPLVLRGASAVLARNRQLVAMIEYDPSKLPSSVAPEAFLDEIFARFTVIYDVNDETRTVAPTTPAKLLATYTRENELHTNLLCDNSPTGCADPAGPAG